MIDVLSDLIIPTGPGEFWTMVVSLATLGLLTVAGRGLGSLKLARKDIQTRAKREAARLSAQRLEEFSREIIPRNNEIRTKSQEANVEMFVQHPGQVDFSSTSPEEIQRARKWAKECPDEIRSEILQLINDLEAWATYFKSGLADEKIAFGPCASPLCSIVIQHYGLFVALRAQENSGNYPNVVGLFNAWRERLDRKARGHTVKHLVDRIQELRDGGVIQYDLPDPIGTNLD